MTHTQLIRTIAHHLSPQESSIQLSKFIHGADQGNSKVLFLITAKSKLIGILKILRDPAYNGKLRREQEGQEWGSKLKTFKTPKVYFSDTVGDHHLYCEEVIKGRPVRPDKAPSLIGLIWTYQQEIRKGKELSPAAIASIFRAGSDFPLPYNELRTRLGRTKGVLWAGQSHGDLTNMNIIVSRDNFYLIDWEQYGERPIWGVDFAHYIARCAAAENQKDFANYLSRFKIDIDRDYFVHVYLIDKLLDILQKNKPDEYRVVIQKLADYTHD